MSPRPVESLPPVGRFAARPGKTLVLGLGNDILSDDAVGFLIAESLQSSLDGLPGCTVARSAEVGLGLLDVICGWDELILIDAVQTYQAAPGFVHQFQDACLKSIGSVSPHFMGIAEMLSFGRVLGLPVPERIRIFAVEVEDPFTVGTALTPRLQALLPEITSQIRQEIAKPREFA